MPETVTERTFYPVLIDEIKRHGGAGISEVKYNSEPDIVFEFLDRRWILSVKLGETLPILKQAFIQYHRHKDESRIDHGILLFLPEDSRLIRPVESEVIRAVNEKRCSCLIDTPYVKEELRAVTFPQLLRKLEHEIAPSLRRGERKEYPLDIVIGLLQQHVSDTMRNIKLTDKEMFRVITDKKLLSEIGHLDQEQSVDTARFLASYIVLSQILFLRNTTTTSVSPAASMIIGARNAGTLVILEFSFSAQSMRNLAAFRVHGRLSGEWIMACQILHFGRIEAWPLGHQSACDYRSPF